MCGNYAEVKIVTDTQKGTPYISVLVLAAYTQCAFKNTTTSDTPARLLRRYFSSAFFPCEYPTPGATVERAIPPPPPPRSAGTRHPRVDLFLSLCRLGEVERLPQLDDRLVRHLHRFLHLDLTVPFCFFVFTCVGTQGVKRLAGEEGGRA